MDGVLWNEGPSCFVQCVGTGGLSVVEVVQTFALGWHFSVQLYSRTVCVVR